MKRFAHQEKIVKENPLWCGLWLGTGGGKTRVALDLSAGKVLVVAPKQQTLDETWQNNASKFGIFPLVLDVISKETFRRDWDKLPYYDSLIFDEAHTVLGVTPDTMQRKGVPIPKTSQLFDAARSYIKKHKPMRLYLCSATPASKPMNVWAAATLLGNDWNYFDFRERFYIQRKIGYRSIWLPRNTKALKEELAEYLKELGYVGRLQDWFDVPEQTHIVKYLSLTKAQEMETEELLETEADPMVQRTKRRSVENGCIYEIEVKKIGRKEEKMARTSRVIPNEKIEYILEKAEEFPKMLIFANYIAQVNDIAEKLQKAGFTTRTLTGQTKDRANVISYAENASECIVIAQSGISAGYELKTVPCVIFASKSYRYLDYEQGLGRVLRADAIKKNLYIHLVVKGGVDEACHDTIMAGEDFQEKIHE